MSSKIKVDNIADQGNNSLINKCGSTITLGASGDTIELASGASQTGFGRTGTVDWQTTKKTASFTAVSGEGYFVDTSSSAITAALPASPTAGAIVYIKDYDGSFGTNACTVARNSSNIRGGTNNFFVRKTNSGAVFIYVDATEGWQVFVDGSDADAQQTYICPTGGTITTCGNFKIHTFTGPGTFTVNELGCSGANDTVDYLVVAGGGGGAGQRQHSGGGGAGGTRFSDCHWCAPSPVAPSAGTALTVLAQGYPITVGSGGSGGDRITLVQVAYLVVPGGVSLRQSHPAGGGGGGQFFSNVNGVPGGSGGGGGSDTGTGGAGNTPPVTPAPRKMVDMVQDATLAVAVAGGGGGMAAKSGPGLCPSISTCLSTCKVMVELVYK